MVLVALAFELSIFGTFLTRSGVVNSIHSFAKSSIGAWFLAFVVISSLFSVALIMWRLPLLKARTKLESALSREATFLYNNLLLVALCLTILWGVLFPIVTQLVKGESRTIGRPYYDFFLRTFGLPLLLLMGIGPLIAWRRTSFRALWRVIAAPAAGALVAGGILFALGAGSSKPGLIAYTFSAFVLGTILLEVVRGTMATGSLFALVSRNRRRYGGYIVHAAIVLFAIGIAGSSAYGSSTERRLTPGQSMKVNGYTLTLRDVRVTPDAERDRDARIPRRARSLERHDLVRRQPVPQPTRAVARGRHPHRLAARRRPLRDRRRRQPGDERRLREGAREAARQPALDRRDRVPARLRGRVVAGRARAAPARHPPRTRTRVTTVALVLGVVLAAGAVLLVALPFLRDPTPVDDRLDAPSEADERQLALVEQRDQALAALKELEFDHRTGKITDEDYRRDVGPLRRTAAAALRRLDDAAPPGAPSGDAATMGAEPDHAIPTKEARLSESQPVPEPTPPPDEGTPPTPAPVPEPYPPPDEATIPSVPQE